MSQIFISHVEEDESIALEIAHGLEAAGYSTWYYERDSLPGVSYLDQIDEAIEECLAVVVIISLDSLSSLQVDKEVERAHEAGKHFFPVLRGVKHVEFQARKRGWRMAMGVSTSISVPADRASTIVPRIVAGLRRLVINSEEPASSPPAGGQTAAQDVSFSEPADHSVETGEARLLQSEAVAEPPLIDTTSTVSDADTNAALESIIPLLGIGRRAMQSAVDVPISRERVAARTDWTIPGIPALLRRVKTRTAMIVLAVLVFLGFAIYGLSKLKLRELVTNSNQAAKTESTSSLTGTIWRRSTRYEVVFKPAGIVQYKWTAMGNRDTYESGHWEQIGNSVKFNVRFDTANSFIFYEFVISPGGNEMEGTERNESGTVSSALLTKVH